MGEVYPQPRRSVLPVASTQTAPSVDAVRTALDGVHDPEINRPITELGMVSSAVSRTQSCSRA